MTLENFYTAAVVLAVFAARILGAPPIELRVGRAGHAFDHLGDIGAQADTAAASGSTIIYATGIGPLGYTGLPAPSEFQRQLQSVAEYNAAAKKKGIELSIGYLCATSIVGLDTFDKYWPAELRSRLKTESASWRQQDRNGRPLTSWYGGDYEAACMSNPDWRTYQKYLVEQTLRSGHDGVFFDNPTVHPEGCYCPHCMLKFVDFLKQQSPAERTVTEESADIEAMRKLAIGNPDEFRRFRTAIASDFLSDMGRSARSINSKALITCNNSLNSPSVLYSQSRTFGYNIFELSKAEDLVVVEDMTSQPRTDAEGHTFEYGPVYKILHAISHGKPVVAVTLADGDYHTPPNLMRLAIGEAAAHGASYLSWPTWPSEQRSRLANAVRPQADFLRRNEQLLNDALFRSDVILVFPHTCWIKTEICEPISLAGDLSRANIQYRVVAADELRTLVKASSCRTLLVESLEALTPSQLALVKELESNGFGLVVANRGDWLSQVRAKITQPSVVVDSSPTVRIVVRDQPGRAIVHLLNLGIRKLSSFEDEVTVVTNLKIQVSVPFTVSRVTLLTADEPSPSIPIRLDFDQDVHSSQIPLTIPRLSVHSIVVLEK